MSFLFYFAWALFIVFEKVTLHMPWPIRHFLIGQFPDEFKAQRAVVKLRSVSKRA